MAEMGFDFSKDKFKEDEACRTGCTKELDNGKIQPFWLR